MSKKFILVLCVVSFGTALLVYQASIASAKTVVTVEQLLAKKDPRKSIRLGARVTKDKINYSTNPKLVLRFNVRDVEDKEDEDEGKAVVSAEVRAAPPVSLPVVYEGIKPDTLQSGRDVILEGRFDGQQFYASTLLTQCPSKYEPPTNYE